MSGSDDHFLSVAVQALSRVRQASQDRGYPRLASMIEFAIAEAQDDLRTETLERERFADFRAAHYQPT
jgi:hypothetical protein